jgi:tetratricopeptide (TPR) repeat protein
VAIFFLVHPQHVESVAWIAERKDVLFGLFWWLTLWAYAGYSRDRNWKRYLLVMLACAASLMSKPMAVTLPCVLLLLDYWPLDRARSMRDAGRLLLEKVPLFVLSAGASAVTFLAQRAEGSVMSAQRISWPARILNAVSAYAAYLRDMLWPTGLAAYYPHPGMDMPVAQIALATLTLVALVFVCVRGFRRQPWNTVGILWYLGTLVPVIGIIQVGLQARADRYTYVPITGILIALVWSADAWCTTAARRRVGMTSGVLIACAMAGATWVQTGYWRDGETLFRRALAVTERNGVAHYNLGVILTRKGALAEAEEQFRNTIQVEPSRKAAYNNLGGVLSAQNRNEEATLVFMDAIQHDPGNPEVYYNLAAALLKLGRVTEAKGRLTEALRLKPDHAEAQYLFGNALLAEGNMKGATERFRKALEANADLEDARMNLGVALMQAGDSRGAAGAFAEVVRRNPAHAIAWSNLGHARVAAGDLRGALDAFRVALERDPANAAVRGNITVLERELGGAKL